MSVIEYSPFVLPSPARRLRSAGRLETLVVAVGICLPVPALSATGLSVPLPNVVERIAAALVPWADTLAHAAPEAPRGEIVRTAAEKRVVVAVRKAERTFTSVAPAPAAKRPRVARRPVIAPVRSSARVLAPRQPAAPARAVPTAVVAPRTVPTTSPKRPERRTVPTLRPTPPPAEPAPDPTPTPRADTPAAAPPAPVPTAQPPNAPAAASPAEAVKQLPASASETAAQATSNAPPFADAGETGHGGGKPAAPPGLGKDKGK